MSDLGLLLKLDRIKQTNRLYDYKPYPFQDRFHHAEGYKTPGILANQRFVIAANKVGKCVSIRSNVETSEGAKTIGEIWGKEASVLTWPDRTPRRVTAWVRKPAEECFRITMSDGRWIECASGHLVLTDSGYRTISEIFASLPKSVFSVRGFRENVRKGALRWWRKLRGFLERYSDCFRLHGGQLLYDQEGVQVFAPLPDGVQGRSLISLSWDATAGRYTSIFQQVFVLLSSLCVAPRTSAQFASSSGQVLCTADQLLSEQHRIPGRSSITGHPVNGVPSGGLCQFQTSSSLTPISIDGNEIISVDSIGVNNIYDMWVEERHNYIAAGLVHHNTYAAAMEVAMHATGIYPDWWKGHRFNHEVSILCGSNTNETCRDLLQRELCGDPEDDEKLGTGSIPLGLIGNPTRKAGVPNAIDNIAIKHTCGRKSKIFFRAYEQGFKKFMGHAYDVIWCDEEPPMDIWSQIVRSIFARKYYCIIATFTPEEGMTKLVTSVLQKPEIGQALIQATWDDAPHMTKSEREKRLAGIPEHEREMRSKGVPLMGEGVVFPFSEDSLRVDPFEIPRHWPQITGIDFGWDHPFAAGKLAWNRDSDTVYLVAEYRESKTIPAVHAATINSWGEWVPVAWPHDGLNSEKGTGESLVKKYRDSHVNLLPWKATLPPSPGEEEGKGSNSVESSILEMYERMETGRFKVFSTCRQFFEEMRMYHRKDGKIVKLNDDLISAVRYAVMMIRHARIQLRPKMVKPRKGASNW